MRSKRGLDHSGGLSETEAARKFIQIEPGLAKGFQQGDTSVRTTDKHFNHMGPSIAP
jgi:hypothetical protein